ncbi:SDR family NAD(P)-dependent oxidoreductase [Indiicoccus explosivorum]|uniref:SDR family NAD(P)-dependent oxidoreductase n=1 Tax=Indiicoccus explosivorum TaxID=1917864 RepID=UPI000B43F553|nr:glucose 1-dehydrogenase [Indiicoccus explosivorum]
MELEGKVILVTGAGGGMGQAIVRKLLAEGAHVAGIDLSEAAMAGLDHERFTAVGADVLAEEAMAEAFAAVHEAHGRIDSLVNAVGIAQAAAPIEDVPLSQWRKLLEINATALFITSKEAVRYMKARREGAIVTIASISAVRPRPGLQAYIASKGAAESFSRALAIEVAPYGIRVNTIHPGPTDTGMLGQFAASGTDAEQAKKEIFADSVPLGRLVKPDDIADSVIHLVSDRTKMMTGAVLHVDGGRGL